MAIIFTRTDKGLLDRAARILDDNGKALFVTHGPVWSATKEGVNAKVVFDRLQRDARDLRMLGKRLMKASPSTERKAAAPLIPESGGAMPEPISMGALTAEASS